MTLSLVRVDDRIIHGQTTTRWTKVRSAFGIIAVGDFAKDSLRRKVLKAAAGNYKLGIYPPEEAADKIQKAKDNDKPYFLISDSIKVFAELVENGVDIGNEINIGPMNTKDGAKVLGRTVAIDQSDYDAFETIKKHGIKINFQLLPDDDIKSWESMKKKYDSMN